MGGMRACGNTRGNGGELLLRKGVDKGHWIGSGYLSYEAWLGKEHGLERAWLGKMYGSLYTCIHFTLTTPGYATPC